MLPAAETSASPTASTMVATTTPSSDKAGKRWQRTPCPFCAQSAQHPSPVDSYCSEEDWDGDIEREKRKEKQRKEEETKQRQRIEKQEKILNLLSSKLHI